LLRFMRRLPPVTDRPFLLPMPAQPAAADPETRG
jgi:hypothetical protein